MSSKGIAFLAFIAGAGMGSVCTWQLLKRKYELIAQEEIDSVKAAYATRESIEKAGKSFVEGFRDGFKVAEDRTQKDEGDVDFKKYASIIQRAIRIIPGVSRKRKERRLWKSLMSFHQRNSVNSKNMKRSASLTMQTKFWLMKMTKR